MEIHDAPTPEMLIQQFTTEQLVQLFDEIGYQVSGREIDHLRSRVIETLSVEQAFQELIDRKQAASQASTE